MTSTLPEPIEAAANLPRPILVSTDARVITMWIMRSRSAGTRRKYQMHAERFLSFLGRPLGTASLGDLQDYLATFEGRAPATVANVTHCLKSLLTFAHEVGTIPLNVGKAVKAPQVKNTLAERIMVATDVRSMLTLETDPRNRALLTVLYGAGLRISEAIGLRWRDLAPRPPSGQATVYGKGGKTRVVLLTANTWQALLGQRDAQDPDAFVFRARPSGRGLGLSQAHRIVKAAAARAGLPPEVSAHWLRHAHASHAIDGGAPIQLVQATLGHANVATTSRYLHARPNESSARFLGI